MTKQEMAGWTFLSNYAHVLICISRNRCVRMNTIAEQVGLTLRAVQRIVSELEQAGVLSHQKSGRRNEYQIDTSFPLRHPLEDHCTVGDLIELVNPSRKG